MLLSLFQVTYANKIYYAPYPSRPFIRFDNARQQCCIYTLIDYVPLKNKRFYEYCGKVPGNKLGSY